MQRVIILLAIFLSISIQNFSAENQNLQGKPADSFFIENKGQWPDEVRYLAKIGGMNAWITDNGVVYDYFKFERNYEQSDLTEMHRQERQRYKRENTTRRGHVVKVNYLNAFLNAGNESVGEKNWIQHYYIGSDQSKWAENVRLYDEVRTTELYEGIDIRYYFDGGLLRYDYKADPNADISQIRIAIDGANGAEVNGDGELVIKTVLGDVVHGKLLAYQNEWYGLRPVECGFVKNTDGSIGIDAAEYNRNKPLTIDPLVYSTFIGGTGFDEGYGVTATLGRRPVITGTTSSTDFPTSVGAYDVTYNGGYDIFVTRLYAGGGSLNISTYIGGSDLDEAYDIAVNSDDDIYITGISRSSTFPGGNSNSGQEDIFICHLEKNGTFVYAKLYGGSFNEYTQSLALDESSGYVYIAGHTESSNFPMAGGGYDNNYGDNGDVFVYRLDMTNGSLSNSTFLGRSSFEFYGSVALDTSGNPVISGLTASSGFPVTAGAFDETHNGGEDGFICKMSQDLSTLDKSTFIGGNSTDLVNGIAVDSDNNILITGYTYSSDYPVTPNAYEGTYHDNSDVILSKVSSDLSALIYSTFLGRNSSDMAKAITLDTKDNPAIIGETRSSNFPVTSDGYDQTFNGNDDIFVSYFDMGDGRLVYSTFLGGTDNDNGEDISFESGVDGGNIVENELYVAGYSTSTDYPTTAGTFQESKSWYSDVVLTKIDGILSTVTLTQPNGDEYYPSGGIRLIKWTSNKVDSVKLELSTDWGATWPIVIADSLPAADQSYTWTIPDLYSRQCMVRVSDFVNPKTNDKSDSKFEIDNREITVTAPNGGEKWKSGSEHEITWTSKTVTDVHLQYSSDNGSTWKNIVSSTPSDGSYIWTVPDIVSTECLVMITDNSSDPHILRDESDNTFEVFAPTVDLTAPDGGENRRAGSVQTISWSVLQVDSMLLQYSTDNGTSWNDITTVAATPNTYSWTVPDLYSTECLVKIIDTEAPIHSDSSQAVFTIDNREVTVVSPNGGETIKAGGVTTIQWTSYNVSDVKLEYSLNNGSTWNVITSSTPSDGMYDWTVPMGTSPQTFVRVSDAGDASIKDRSDNTFVILPSAIAVLQPNGGEVWKSGTINNIDWSVFLIDSLTLQYSTDNGSSWTTIVENYPALPNSYSWTVPSENSANCLVKIIDAEVPTYTDVSDGTFTIDNRGVTVTAPNGGEELEAGTTYPVTWSSVSLTNVKIEYSADNGTSWNTIVNAVDADLGTFNWTVPNNPSDTCLIKMTGTADTSINDQSDAVFEIFEPSLIVTDPNGGGAYRAGSVEQISWTARGVDNLKLEYSDDNGTNWYVITPFVDASTGSYDWTIPNTASTECFVRLSDALDPAVTDISDAAFTIEKPSADINYISGWNVLSVPFSLDDGDPANTFPTKTSEVFAYSSGYYQLTNLQPAEGFWIQFSSTGTETVYGSGHSDSTVQVLAGWNIIGTPDYDVSVDSITSTPAGIIESVFYEYGGGYSPVSVLMEGKGYWVKCSQAGELLLPRNSVIPKTEPVFETGEDWITITVSDAAGNRQELYIASAAGNFELPPIPPAQIFDVRFGDETYLCVEEAAQMLKFQSEHYPLTINVTGANLKLTDGASGKVVNYLLRDGNSFTLTNSNVSNLHIRTVEIPSDYILYQNYPNPFNPATTIKFGLPESGKVTLEIYDQLGQKVETLISEEMDAGYHELEWNAIQYSSGVYFYTISAGNFKAVKKMLLLK